MPERLELGLPSSIAALRRELTSGRLTADAVAGAVQRRLEGWRHLNAFITPMLDGPPPAGIDAPLLGVPIGVKDFFDTAGVRTTAGFAQFENRIPASDAEMVSKLRQAGALIVGKTNMDRLGMSTTGLESDFGPVVNPWRADLVAGGSSSGSAAAVAAGICYATIDTDAAGSARLPAACCNVVGFKPGAGCLSSDGILRGEEADPEILAFSHPSIIAHRVEDAELMFRVLSGLADQAPPQPRLALAANFQATDGVRAVFQAAVESIFGKVEPIVDVPFSEASFDASGIDEARKRIDETLFADTDAVLLPTLSDLVPSVATAKAAGAMGVAPTNTFFANYFGLPAISVPTAHDETSGPTSLQIVGRPGGELTVLALAKQAQQSYPPRFAELPTLPFGATS